MGGGEEEHGRQYHRGMSKLSTAFTVIFVITLAALLAQLIYILLRRRLFRRQASTDAVDDNYTLSSKEQFLYFFCVRAHTSNHRRPVETMVPNNNCTSGDYPSSNADAMGNMSIEVDVLKLQGMFGPPRFLFTIKEEDEDQERDFEDEGDGTVVRVFNRAMSLKQCFEADDGEVEGDGGGSGGASLFSTPCASPAFFTPSDSPVHVSVNGGSTDEEMVLPK